jgi:hypothetical protein
MAAEKRRYRLEEGRPSDVTTSVRGAPIMLRGLRREA